MPQWGTVPVGAGNHQPVCGRCGVVGPDCTPDQAYGLAYDHSGEHLRHRVAGIGAVAAAVVVCGCAVAAAVGPLAGVVAGSAAAVIATALWSLVGPHPTGIERRTRP